MFQRATSLVFLALSLPACHGGPAANATRGPKDTPAVFLEYVKGDPARWFDCIDASDGVVVATTLSCERQQPVQDFRRVCGAKARATLEPMFQRIQTQARRLREVGSEGQLECDEKRPYVCRIPGLNECQPQYEIRFSESGPCPIQAVIERDDDFQSDDAVISAANTRIDALLGSSTCSD